MKTITIVTGLSASGKDYVIDQVKELTSESIFYLGGMIHEEMRKVDKKRYGGETALKEADNYILMEAARKSIKRITDCPNDLILNAHIVYRRKEAIVIDPSLYRELKPTNIVFIYSDPKEIKKRRETDPRDRKKESIEEIAFNQDCAIFMTKRLCKDLDCNFYKITNKPGSNKAVQEVLKIVAKRND